jgi:vanillate O-demethylase ferredoxin subunit
MESFTTDSSENSAPADTFEIVLRSGRRLHVERDKSILETLEDNGIDVPFSCREGLCRTCETRILAGQADHRDWVLSDTERAAQTTILICVSRALTPVLELDI